MKALFTITIEIELSVDSDECGREWLSDDGWEIATQFDKAMDKLRYEYGWDEIKKVGMPKFKGELK